MRVDYSAGKIRIVDFNSVEAYKIGRKIEKDGIQFYAGLLQKNFDPETSEIMKFLISEEKSHLKLFEERLLAAKQTSEDGFEEDAVFDYVDAKIFYPFDAIVELDRALTDKEKALRLGIEIENNSISFYEACLLNSQEKRPRKI